MDIVYRDKYLSSILSQQVMTQEDFELWKCAEERNYKRCGLYFLHFPKDKCPLLYNILLLTIKEMSWPQNTLYYAWSFLFVLFLDIFIFTVKWQFSPELIIHRT